MADNALTKSQTIVDSLPVNRIEADHVTIDDFSEMFNSDPELWIFGYGSLMWFPGFEYENSLKGVLNGYLRRFYQGNMTFRGTNELPGRVVTLIESNLQSDQTHGLLFKVSGWSPIVRALEHLAEREVANGYSFVWVTVNDMNTNLPIRALTCIAGLNNRFYLGPSDSIADQIAKAQGFSGPNTDYLFKLAHWARKFFPDLADDHLYDLERLVAEILL